MMPASVQSPPPTLAQLLETALPPEQLQALSGFRPSGLSLDSRRVRTGEAFFALGGSRTDGLKFVRQALAAGAAAVVHEATADESTRAACRERGIPLVHLPRLREQLGLIAARFYGEPSRSVRVAGVTGTDGKSSVSHFIAQALDRPPGRPEMRSGLIGTLGSGLYGETVAGIHTTPDAIEVQRTLAGLRDAGAAYAAMEVSSHGLEQGRVNGVRFAVAVLTNLGRDHLDYHGNPAAYRAAKQRLFEDVRPGAAVLNAHDEFGRALLDSPGRRCPVTLYGLDEAAVCDRRADDWLYADRVQWYPDGFEMEVVVPDGRYPVACKLLGDFNVLNVLAAFGALRRLEWEAGEIAGRLNRLSSVSGRMQLMSFPGRPVAVIDYAHTPQALETVLKALRRHCPGRLWCVFGCGGERDRGKRPEMGRIAETLADRVIVTDDNPRHEAPGQIVADIVGGIEDRAAVTVIRDRAAAIGQALAAAVPGDVVLIAGKGHEDYQQVGDERRPFSDAAVVDRAWGGTP